MPKYYFQTFGCQMNVADSDMIAELLNQRGFESVDSSNEADIVIVNTCSVRKHAENRAKARIKEFAGLKNKKEQSIWVVGCMAERMGHSLKEEIPGIDEVIGAQEVEYIDRTLNKYLENFSGDTTTSDQTGKRISVFIPIMRGCDNYCSYCVVPYVRGKEHSIPANAIKEQIERAVDSGAREVTLLGQNVNSYDTENCDFPDLLARIHKIDKLERIRFTTSHPKDCSEKLVKTIAESPKICDYIHLPVQSGSTRILQLMNRKYTRDDYLKLTDMIRTHIPNVDLSTDVMVGFPGEIEDEFRETLSLFERVRFTTAFMFAYSKREETKAAGMKDTVPEKEKKARLTELINLQTEITKSYYNAMSGKECEVLITERQKKRDRFWMGQDYGCKNVLVPCNRDISGTILNVKIARSTGMTLVAERI